jgi:GMP synthase (glutamine-hydrolysing)
MKNVLLLKAGEAAPLVKLGYGDYDRWFQQSMAASCRLHVVQAYLGEKLPNPRRFDALMMTGSPLSVTQPTGWMLRAGEYLINAAEKRQHVLGVCFGHQLLGHLLGAKVVRNKLGRESGTVEVQLTRVGREDPLFEGLPDRLTVQATHEDVVENPVPGMEILASNALCANQAFRYGKHLRAVQFHPELAPTGMREVILARATTLDREAQARGAAPGERVPTLLAGLRPSPQGPAILLNFLNL